MEPRARHGDLYGIAESGASRSLFMTLPDNDDCGYECGQQRQYRRSKGKLKPGLTAQTVEQPAQHSIDESLLDAVRHLRTGAEVDHSFRVIDSELRPRLLGYFRANWFSREAAQDLVQETLSRVYLNVWQLEDEGRFLGWLFAIARNVRRTAVEKHLRERELLEWGVELAEALPDHRDPSWSYDQKRDQERLDAVGAAIDVLPPQQRQCLYLRVHDELSYEEIAETLRLSVNTIRNHLAAAKKNLRRAFDARLTRAA